MKKIKLDKPILIIILIIFLSPFLGLYINKYLGINFGGIETFGLSLKDFFPIWIAVFGAIGVSINIIIHQQRLAKQQEQINIQAKGERNNRFSKAVELLGNNRESVRIGAVHSLIFLAKEYRDEYKSVVHDILCSHIRTTTISKDYQVENNEIPSNEIKTIFNLLFCKTESYDFFDGLIPDLSGSFLKGIKLYNSSLNNAILTDVNLDNSILIKINFIQAQLGNTTLRSSQLTDCDFRSATILNSKFINTVINRVHFEDSYISDSNFEESTLYSPHFEGANIINSHYCITEIDGGFFEGANIGSGTFFICSTINKNQFQGANLTHLLFWGSSISNTSFDCAHLKKINFEGCDFSSSSILSGGDFEIDTTEMNDFFGNRTILLRKQRNKETHIGETLSFGLLQPNHKKIIEKRLKEHGFHSQTIDKVKSALEIDNIESLKSYLNQGVFDNSEVDKIIEKITSIELKCGGWRQNRKTSNE